MKPPQKPSEKSPSQIPLDLAVRPALDAADFMVADANAEAVAWVDRWPEWSPPGLVVYGPEACGKSHLARVYLARSEATCLLSDDLRNPDLRPDGSLYIDAADTIVGDLELETALFHLLNRAREKGATVLLTTRSAPAHLPFVLPDTASRVRAFPAAEIHAPDDGLLSVLIVKHFADRQVRVEPEVIRYIVSRCERSFAAIRDAVVAIDNRALSEKRAITVPLVRDVLSAGSES